VCVGSVGACVVVVVGYACVVVCVWGVCKMGNVGVAGRVGWGGVGRGGWWKGGGVGCGRCGGVRGVHGCGTMSARRARGDTVLAPGTAHGRPTILPRIVSTWCAQPNPTRIELKQPGGVVCGRCACVEVWCVWGCGGCGGVGAGAQRQWGGGVGCARVGAFVRKMLNGDRRVGRQRVGGII